MFSNVLLRGCLLSLEQLFLADFSLDGFILAAAAMAGGEPSAASSSRRHSLPSALARVTSVSAARATHQ